MKKEPFYKREYLPLNKLVNNTGQIPGVPANPRFIRDESFKALVSDMENDPEMLELKEPWVYPLDGKYVVFAGNMRFRGAKDLKRNLIPCKIVPEDSTAKQIKGWAIKDNVERGEWDQDALANEWDENGELKEWGVKTPVWDSDISNNTDYSDNSVDDFLDKYMNAKVKNLTIVFASEEFDSIIPRLESLIKKTGSEDYREMLYKVLENEGL